MMAAEQYDPAEADVTMYSKPACVQCRMTARALDKEGITYTTVDLTQSETAIDYVQHELGYSAAPVVVVNADSQNHWAGFQPDKIAQVSKFLTGANANRASAPGRGQTESSRDGPTADPIATAFPPIETCTTSTSSMTSNRVVSTAPTQPVALRPHR